jgi:hypothetical protein
LRSGGNRFTDAGKLRQHHERFRFQAWNRHFLGLRHPRLRDLVAEYKSSGPAYWRTMPATLRGSYTGHYRRGLIRLLEVLHFSTASSACQPVIEALAPIHRYAAAGSLTYYPAGEHVPAHAPDHRDWKPLVYRTDQHSRQRVVRMVYEAVTFQALREHLRCKEIWITGADRWRIRLCQCPARSCTTPSEPPTP